MFGIIHLHTSTCHKTPSAKTPLLSFSAVKNQKTYSLQKIMTIRYWVQKNFMYEIHNV